jgi:hypothetical protein
LPIHKTTPNEDDISLFIIRLASASFITQMGDVITERFYMATSMTTDPEQIAHNRPADRARP